MFNKLYNLLILLRQLGYTKLCINCDINGDYYNNKICVAPPKGYLFNLCDLLNLKPCVGASTDDLEWVIISNDALLKFIPDYIKMQIDLIGDKSEQSSKK